MSSGGRHPHPFWSKKGRAPWASRILLTRSRSWMPASRQAANTMSSRMDGDRANPADYRRSSASSRGSSSAKANATAVLFETGRSSLPTMAE